MHLSESMSHNNFNLLEDIIFPIKYYNEIFSIFLVNLKENQIICGQPKNFCFQINFSLKINSE